MRILIVSQYYWPESFRINDLSQGLLERGHEVVVLTGQPNYPGGRFYTGYSAFAPFSEDHAGIRVLRAPLIPRGDGSGWRLILNYLSFALSASLVGLWKCRENWDAILVFEPSPVTVGIPGVVISRWTGTPMYFWVQDLWPETLLATGAVRSRPVLGLVSRLVRFIYRNSARVLVQSRAFVDSVVATGACRERVGYFPNSAEALYRQVDVAEDAPERQELPPGFNVVFAGNIGEAQSFETIVAAAEQLRDQQDINWVIIGSGRRLEWLEAQLSQRGLAGTVQLIGQRPMETMPVYFALADALLVTLRPDPVFALTVPSKVQSYLACGRPVIAALDGEGAEIIAESGAGIAVSAGDATALSEAVRDLYQLTAEERQAMGEAGRRYFAENFARDMLLDRLIHWMETPAREVECVS